MNNKRTRFTRLIRIDPKQIKYLKETKEQNNCRTLAGLLDLIINKFKDETKNSNLNKDNGNTND